MAALWPFLLIKKPQNYRRAILGQLILAPKIESNHPERRPLGRNPRGPIRHDIDWPLGRKRPSIFQKISIHTYIVYTRVTLKIKDQ